MNFTFELLDNYMLVTAVTAWFLAQVIKTLIDAYFNKSINWERMTGSGGMPSSHSSFVVSMTTAAAIEYGMSSSIFAVCFVLSSVVMYDAMGVRRETGKQAVLLNKMLEDNPFHWKPEEFEMKLKEYVGHTPLQVLMGAILGILVAFFVKTRY
jgi:acid phosphatase family membrane protein YuiD